METAPLGLCGFLRKPHTNLQAGRLRECVGRSQTTGKRKRRHRHALVRVEMTAR